MRFNVLYLSCPELNGILHLLISLSNAREVLFRLLNK